MKNSQADELALRRRKTRLAFVMLTFYSAFDGSDISQIEGVYFIQHYVSKILPRIWSYPLGSIRGFFLTPFNAKGLALHFMNKNTPRF